MNVYILSYLVAKFQYFSMFWGFKWFSEVAQVEKPVETDLLNYWWSFSSSSLLSLHTFFDAVKVPFPAIWASG